MVISMEMGFHLFNFRIIKMQKLEFFNNEFLMFINSTKLYFIIAIEVKCINSLPLEFQILIFEQFYSLFVRTLCVIHRLFTNELLSIILFIVYKNVFN